jgi:hypothetical protein
MSIKLGLYLLLSAKANDSTRSRFVDKKLLNDNNEWCKSSALILFLTLLCDAMS